ncbi:MAG: rod shape-determining protein MreD [Eubacteriales bacterium]
MRLSRENKNVYIRRLIFVCLLMLTAMLQNTDGLFPEIFGVRAMLLIPAVVCISMYERDISGIFFGLFAGLLWDTVSAGPQSFNAIMLTMIGFVSGVFIGTIMRNNIVTALLLTAAAVFIYNTLYWLIAYVFNSYSGAWLEYFSFYLPACIYTIVLMPGFYYLVRLIRNKTR